jgi:uncharacterized protein YdhG (YjbR/CyaY superfamily)
MRSAPTNNVDAYIAAFPKPAQAMMKQLRAAIKSTAHDVTEKISYGIPFYEYKYPGYKGRLVYFGGFKNHVSIFAWGREVDKYKELSQYKTSKGTIQFPLGVKIPVALVKKIVKLRMKQIDRSVKKKAPVKRPL